MLESYIESGIYEAVGFTPSLCHHSKLITDLFEAIEGFLEIAAIRKFDVGD